MRTLGGVTAAGRPLFLKMVYHGPKAMEELVHYDPHLVVGILGGSAGTTYDAFKLLSEAKKYGGRVALFGRKINNAENQLAFVQLPAPDRRRRDRGRGSGASLSRRPAAARASSRSGRCEDDMKLQTNVMNYGGNGVVISTPPAPASPKVAEKPVCAMPAQARRDRLRTNGKAQNGTVDFTKMTAAEKVAYHKAGAGIAFWGEWQEVGRQFQIGFRSPGELPHLHQAGDVGGGQRSLSGDRATALSQSLNCPPRGVPSDRHFLAVRDLADARAGVAAGRDHVLAVGREEHVGRRRSSGRTRRGPACRWPRRAGGPCRCRSRRPAPTASSLPSGEMAVAMQAVGHERSPHLSGPVGARRAG